MKAMVAQRVPMAKSLSRNDRVFKNNLQPIDLTGLLVATGGLEVALQVIDYLAVQRLPEPLVPTFIPSNLKVSKGSHSNNKHNS